MNYILPKVLGTSFTCPHCGAIAKQDWWLSSWEGAKYDPRQDIHQLDKIFKIRIGVCQHCNQGTIWVDDKMHYPDTGNVPHPKPEMPQEVLKLYLEAASIYSKSPRAAAALLRLSIQILCKELGEPGKNINTDIASLVEKSLPVIVKEALDVVRVIGNDAVHPGQIDTDDPETVKQLFDLVNIIVDYMITLPNKVSGIHSSLPADKLKGINERDT